MYNIEWQHAAAIAGFGLTALMTLVVVKMRPKKAPQGIPSPPLTSIFFGHMVYLPRIMNVSTDGEQPMFLAESGKNHVLLEKLFEEYGEFIWVSSPAVGVLIVSDPDVVRDIGNDKHNIK